MADVSPSPKKVHPDNEDLENLSKADLISRLKDQELYIKQIESKKPKYDKGDDDNDTGDKLKQQQKEAARRENTLVHRLTTKEQELQDFITQIAEMKQAQTQGTAQLKSMLLDPAVNIVFQKMSKELEEAQEKLKQTQNELSAWKFTPDSQTGKRLMARCQMLLQENEELGKTISSGRTAKLEGDIALQKTLVTEMKNNQSELDEFLGDLEEDVEGMQTMIYVLQQQLRDAKEQITYLEEENARLRTGDTSVPTKTFPKKPDKVVAENPHVKTEKHQNAKVDRSGTANSDVYTPMETSEPFYQERTDSDLEAEYNYEGLYENEDQYQEELEAQAQQNTAEASSENYEENGYKHYDEEYESQEYKTDFRERESGDHEAMETDDTRHTNSADRTTCNQGNNDKIAHRRSSPAPLREVKTEVTDSTSSDQVDHTSSQYTSSSNTGESRQHEGHSADNTDPVHTAPSDQPTPATDSRNNTTEQQTGDVTSTRQSQATVADSNTMEKTARIPSPSLQPTKVSPVKMAAQRTDETVVSHTTTNVNNKSNGSPTATNNVSPYRTSSSPNPLTANENTADADLATIPTSNDKSNPDSAGPDKDREPVLQPFLNGITSTVDDIEDL